MRHTLSSFECKVGFLMEISSITGLPDQEMMGDPTLLHQWHSDDSSLLPMAAAFGETLQHHSFTYPNFNLITPMNQFQLGSNHMSQFQLGLQKLKDEMGCPTINITTPLDMISQGNLEDQNYVFKTCQEDHKKILTRPKLSQPQDHIIAERKRREKLSQQFIALSALVPGLQKMDKASVLGDTIKYLKQLQEKVRALEEEQNLKKNVQSVVIVKKSQLSNDVENYSLESGGSFDKELPEIEARFCERNVLIRVHCEKSKGVVEKTIHEIEKLHLKVINSTALTFGSCALDITIIAQMDVGFCMTVKDLVRKLRSAFTSFM
ncbi:transcription factor bHLH25-like isoform X2 [Lotus japonicus]|uniref:transcription factor bHLH25-like isoform X2 n=1 Tax=Lotus japonicus TaxID=34305 RepID=UPI00258E78D9|nr:transcription factor bHLH25-like isoform X2 [Lotus japonicus]